jgi:hypothetical protein
MSVDIPVRRITHKGYILEFIVTDEFTIHTLLCTASDPTMVDSNYIVIDSTDFYRGGEVDEASGEVIESSIETMSEFALRAFAESKEWADESIAEQARSSALASTLEKVLPLAADR